MKKVVPIGRKSTVLKQGVNQRSGEDLQGKWPGFSYLYDSKNQRQQKGNDPTKSQQGAHANGLFPLPGHGLIPLRKPNATQQPHPNVPLSVGGGQQPQIAASAQHQPREKPLPPLLTFVEKDPPNASTQPPNQQIQQPWSPPKCTSPNPTPQKMQRARAISFEPSFGEILQRNLPKHQRKHFIAPQGKGKNSVNLKSQKCSQGQPTPLSGN